MSRKLIYAGVAGVAVFGATVASAASLGGVNSTSLGSGDTIVASCDTDGVDIDYTLDYDTVNGYEITEVVVTGIAAACTGQDLDLTLADSAGNALDEATVAVTGDTANVTVANTPAAEAVTGAHIVISG